LLLPMKNTLALVLMVFGSFGASLQANQTMFLRCDGISIDEIGDNKGPENFQEVEVLEINVEDGKVRWNNKETQLYRYFFEDGEVSLVDEYINMKLKLNKQTGILKEDRMYYPQGVWMRMTYQCSKTSSKSLW